MNFTPCISLKADLVPDSRQTTEFDPTYQSLVSSIAAIARTASASLRIDAPVADLQRFVHWPPEGLPALSASETTQFCFAVPVVGLDGSIVLPCRASDLDPAVARMIEVLVGLLAKTLEADLLARSREQDKRRLTAAAAESDQRFRILADTMPQIVWSTLPDGHYDYYNKRWYEFTGMPEGSTDGDGWKGMFHPEDQDRAWRRWRHSLKTGEAFEIEYRLRNVSGEYRWTLGRALPMRDENGAIVRWFGTCTDIHEQRLLFEQRQLVTQELSHRIKNIFAIVAGLVSLSSRRYPEAAGTLDSIRDRILALGRAHDFVRPHSSASAPTALPPTLQGLLRELLAPYQTHNEDRIIIKGADFAIDDQATTPIALVFHELATNAAKYGALSLDQGKVFIDISEHDGQCSCCWLEQGGPVITDGPATSGFGSTLVDISITRQLGGTIAKDWNRAGLRSTITIPIAALQRKDVK